MESIDEIIKIFIQRITKWIKIERFFPLKWIKSGKNVRIYQGVTLGALSLPKDAGEKLRGKKRHPTIEDGVIIYAESTILGAKAVIGARSVIGGNVWLTEPVPPDTRVMMETPRLIYK